MTTGEVLRWLLQRLSHVDEVAISWEQANTWPDGLLDVLCAAGWLKPTTRAITVECPGCEDTCLMPVRVRPGRNAHPARAYVVCERRSEVGQVKIALSRLQQWQLTRGQLASWVTRALGLKGSPEKHPAGGRYTLGTVHGRRRLQALDLRLDAPVCLVAGEHSLPLHEVVWVEHDQLLIDQAAVVSLIDLSADTATPVSTSAQLPQGSDQPEGPDIGSAEWRKKNARMAANARHDKPGGSRDKQRQIKEIWASGKYTTRDRCAEQECDGLEMSFSTAIKALRNTPDPSRC